MSSSSVFDSLYSSPFSASASASSSAIYDFGSRRSAYARYQKKKTKKTNHFRKVIR